MQEHLYKHFEREGRTEILDDVSITLVDKTDDSDPTKRERERITGCKRSKLLHLTALMLKIVSS